MIVPDVNLLVYAHDERSPSHEAARDWWQRAVNGEEVIGMPWPVVVAFIRLTTSPRLFANPLHPRDAVDIVQELLDRPNVQVIHPTEKHLTLVKSLLIQAKMGGSAVPDAHLSALAIEHQATLYSHDRDFRRFSGLRLRDPLYGRTGG